MIEVYIGSDIVYIDTNDDSWINVVLSHNQIGNLIFTSREQVAKTLKKLEAEGLYRKNISSTAYRHQIYFPAEMRTYS